MAINYAAIIKERVSCREMIEATGVAVDRRGMAKCPFHGDRDASLKVYRESRRGWHCYGCHAGGDVIDYAGRYYGLEFRDAMAKINDMFALGLPLRDTLTAEQRRVISEEIRKKAAERQAHRRREQEAESAYWAAYDAWLANETTIRDDAPRGRQEPSQRWLDAMAAKPAIKDALDLAEDAWRRERERYWQAGGAAQQ